jgi:catecholate siderophore receptor
LPAVFDRFSTAIRPLFQEIQLAHIRSRKHPQRVQPKLGHSLAALAVLALPAAVHAQDAAKDARALPEIQVKGQAQTETFKAEQSASPKLTQPLVDTPQTISIIKKEVLQEQGATSLMEALRNTPGITIQLGENGNTAAGDTFSMRGFSSQSAVFVDGMRDLGAVTRDVFNLDQVEVVKGPAGADIGRGATTGYINLISKLPMLEDIIGATVSWNTADNKRVTADLNKPLGPNSAFRLNVLAQDGGVFGRDHVENRSLGVAPAFAFGLNTPTRFYLYSQHVRQDNVPDGGVPTIGLPGYFNATAAANVAPRVNSENWYGLNSDFEKVDADMVTGRIEHDFGKGLTLVNSTRYGKSSMERVLTGVGAVAVVGANRNDWTVARSRHQNFQKNELLTNQTNLTAKFNTGALEHTLATGVEFIHEKQTNTTYGGLGTVAARGIDPVNTADLYDPNPSDALTGYNPQPNGAFTSGRTNTAAAYVFDTVKLNEQWLLNGGVRFEHYNTETNAVAISTATSHPTLPVGTFVPSNLKKSDNLTSWKVGAVYKPAHNGSVYVAYATSLKPPGGDNFALSGTAGNINNPALDAQKTRNIELGTKWDVLNKKLSLTAAVYRTDNENEFAQVDPVSNTFAQFGKRRVQGVELGAVGQITPAWQVIAGIATMDTEIRNGSTGNNATGAASRWSPDVTATLWTSYKLAGGWTIGGGARYVSEQKRVIDPSLAALLATQNMPTIPSYWVADAMVSYQVNKNMSLQLNLFNLADKFYINTLNNGGTRYTPGAPRSATLTANLSF